MSNELNLDGRVLVLRSSDKDRQSYGRFQWPESGPVQCPDWIANQECGNGLHGLLWGEGSFGLLNTQDDAVFQVVSVAADSVIDLDGKVKFPEGIVIYSGDRFAAGALVSQHAPRGTKVHFSTATAGDRGTATAGDEGTATAGDRGTATAGYRGTATAGDRGTATAGDEGTATAGEQGYLAIKSWVDDRYRWFFAEVDGESILPNTPYRLDENNQFVRVCDDQ